MILNKIMDLFMSSLGTLIPERPCYMFYAIRYQAYQGLTHVVFCWYSYLILQTHTHKNTQHTQGPID